VAAISNAEPLLDHQREAIQTAFRCPVRNTYGVTELVIGSSECAHGTMHLWPEVGMVEVLEAEEDGPVHDANIGRLVCTSLINEDMPLVRYEVGDRGRLAVTSDCSGCDRRMPILADVEGRLDDVIVTPDGRRIGRLDPVFKGDFRIREAQIVQETLNRLRVRFVPASGFDEREGAVLIARMRERVGAMEVVLESVDSIPRSAGGKFRAVLSQLTVDGGVRSVPAVGCGDGAVTQAPNGDRAGSSASPVTGHCSGLVSAGEVSMDKFRAGEGRQS
jgi:phenylacetate-CoA ligase